MALRSFLKMKTILIICGTFPPQSDVGGLRPAMFCKYLPEFGWEPFVLTRDYPPEDPRFDTKLDLGKIVDDRHIVRVPFPRKEEEAYIAQRGLAGLFRDFFMPEYSSPPGLLDRMKNAAAEIFRNQRFDVILSTSPDQWELTLGALLSKEYGIPLVADFRDIAEQEAGMRRPLRQIFQVLRLLSRRSRTVQNAEFLTTVSRYHQETLQRKTGKKTILVYNGFDEALFCPITATKAVGKGPFRITYTGRILNLWYQNPAVLFRAIDELISAGKIGLDDVLLDFYGVDLPVLAPLLEKLESRTFFRFNPKQAYNNMPLILAQSQMLLVLTNRGRKGVLTTKFFEYIGMKKPILCVPGDGGELDGLIRDSCSGFSIGSKEELKAKLVEWIGHWKNKDFPDFMESNVAMFTRKNQAKLLSDEMNKLQVVS